MSYKICSETVMDSSDSRIRFNDEGICDHAVDFKKNVLPRWRYQLDNPSLLDNKISLIKKNGRNSEYDCILGLSGGIDSSYLLHLAVREYGLRPLVFHVDGGWNSELAVHNIHVLVDKLGLDLYTEVINWNEMRDFQLAFFKSGVPHIDLPQDHAFIATLYNYAVKHGIRYILNGGNISTECVRNPMEFFYYGTDMIHIRDIINRFSLVKMKTYPFSSIFRHKIYLRYVRKIQVVRPLDYRPYVKVEAARLLEQEYGWKPYPQKHFESRFTKFYESYWLPQRFGFDPRRVQFSSLILTGQMTREEALKSLEKPAYDPATIEQEFEYIANKLQVSMDELNHYFAIPKKFYWDYKNQEKVFNLGATVLKAMGLEASIKR